MRTQGAGGGVMASNTTLQEADSGAGLVVDNHDETSLVIAVCVLGTLVGVVIVMSVIVMVIKTGCCSDWKRCRRWVSGKRHRDRGEKDFEELAAVTTNFISDSMLPGNRTGASENLGIRSPNPRGIPELRTPDDLSPSPPFNPAAAPVRAMMRDRLPSPQRQHRRTVLNTIVPQHSPEHHMRLFSHKSHSFTEEPSPTRRKRYVDFNKGDYERISDMSPKTHGGISTKVKHKSRPVEAENEGYPDTNFETDEEVEQCKGYGHSYYKPGGYSSYVPQNIIDRKSKADFRRSPRRRSRNLYARVPSFESTNEEFDEKLQKLQRQRQKQVLPTSPGRNQEYRKSQYSQKKEIESVLSSDTTYSQKKQYDRSPLANSLPLASSSRNTSIDNSEILSEKKREGGCRKKCKHRANPVATSPSRVLHTDRDCSNKCARGLVPITRTAVSAEAEDSSASALPTKGPLTLDNREKTYQDGQPPRHNIICLSASDASTIAAAAGLRIPGAITFIQTSTGLIPATSMIVPNSAIQVMAASRNTTDSFRRDCIASSNIESTDIHTDNNSKLTENVCPISNMTLPNLLATINTTEAEDNAQSPSVLYQHSHHSTQSVQPTFNIMGGSSSFATTRSIQSTLLKTPVSQSIGGLQYDIQPMHGSRFQLCLETPNATEGKRSQGSTFLDMTAVSETVKDRGEDDQQLNGQNLVPLSPRSSTSSSSVPEVGVAIEECKLPSDNTSLRHPQVPSFLDSRELVDPTTASMSWDHLTPDPSPVAEDEGNKVSHYTPKYRNKRSKNHDVTSHSNVPYVGTEFDDTFSRHYELKPYTELVLPSNTRIAANFNPAIEEEINEQQADSNLRKNLLRRGVSGNSSQSETHPDASYFGHTRGRQNVPIMRKNIVDRFYNNDILGDSITSVKSEESFSTPLLSSKRKASLNDISSKRTTDYDNTLKNTTMTHDEALTSTRGSVLYSKLKQTLSVQASVDN